MAECFCGCGRVLADGFTTRAINKQGRRTVGLLAKLRDARAVVGGGGPIKKPKRALTLAIAAGDLDEDDFETVREHEPDKNPFATMVVEVLDDLIVRGDYYDAVWQNVAHGETQMTRGLKKAWSRWGRQGMALCNAIGVRISRSGAFSGEV
jgi:hypothetical protein